MKRRAATRSVPSSPAAELRDGLAAQGLDLKTFLRNGATDRDLTALLKARWRRRDDRYSELRSEQTRDLPRPEMFRLGG